MTNRMEVDSTYFKGTYKTIDGLTKEFHLIGSSFADVEEQAFKEYKDIYFIETMTQIF